MAKTLTRPPGGGKSLDVIPSFGPSDIVSIRSERSQEGGFTFDVSPDDSESVMGATSKSRVRYTSKTLYWTRPPPPIPDSLENRKWHELQLDLGRLAQEENAYFFDHAGRSVEPKPIADPTKAYGFVSYRYIKYCVLAKKLDECYLYLVHPQKRLLLKACLMAVIKRILELKDELVQIEQREYQFFEEILQDLHKTFDDIELRIPLVIREERARVLRDREKVLNILYDKYQARMSEGAGTECEQMSKEEAILLIQRQTRYFLGVIKSEMAQKVLRPKTVEWRDSTQKLVVGKWRIHATRQETFNKRLGLERMLGMIPGNETPLPAVDPLAVRNQVKVKVNEEEFELDKVVLEQELFEKEGPYMAWSLHYNIKQWLLEVRDILGKFPPFPDEEEGGSALLFSDMEIQDVAADLDINVVNGKVTYPKPEKPVKPKKEVKVVKPSPWGPESFDYIIDETDSMREMKALTLQYNDFWYLKDDSSNILQRHDRELLKEQIRPQVEQMIRLQVDELIRAELENLTFAIDREPRPGPKQDKKKPKKEKDQRARGKNKDPTADRTIEELFEELVAQGIICYSPKASLDEFLGEHSYSGCAMDYAKKDPLPALANVRRLITTFAVLPLSSQVLHESAPLIRKLLIAGVRGTGKKLLLRAICHETGANLFDLTPANLEGKFDSPQGKKMLMHLIMKVGKAMEPSVFWIGDCEKLFLKKKDKADTSKPHQWASILHKTIKKGIKNGDRMMLVGTSSMPYMTKQKKFNKFFDRFVIIPHPDYSSRYLAWKHFISTNIQGPVPPYFDLGSLTKVTTGYTIAAIKETCAKVLTDERKATFMFHPLLPSDFVNFIWRLDPIYREEHELFLAWYNETPLAKARLERIHAEENEGGDDKKK